MVEIPIISLDTIKIKKLEIYISRLVAYELSRLSEPCYKPKFVKYNEEILNILKIPKESLMQLYKNFMQHQKKEDFNIIKSEIILATIVTIINLLVKNKYKTVELFIQYLTIRFYSNEIHRFFRYCDNGVWEKTLVHLSQKHLFRDKEGIQNALVYLSKVIFERHNKQLKSITIDEHAIFKFFYEIRTRIAQTMRSFASTYYNIYQHGNKEKLGGDLQKSEEKISEDITIKFENIAVNICGYKYIDKDSAIKAIINTKIRNDVAYDILKIISIPQFKDNIKLILLIINKNIPTEKWCSISNIKKIVKKILEDKIKFKNYSVKTQINTIIENSEIKYDYSTIKRDLIISFIANYILIFSSSKLCH